MERKNAEFLEVTIAGVPLRLKSSHEPETFQRLVDQVDSKVQEILKLSKSSSVLNAAILTALNFADELLIMKQQTQNQLNHLESLVQSAMTDLEASRISQTGLDS